MGDFKSGPLAGQSKLKVILIAFVAIAAVGLIGTLIS